MKTNQILESTIDRTINGVIVRQRTKDKFFALKDATAVCDKFYYEQNRPRCDINQYFRLNSTKEFIAELAKVKQIQVLYKQTKSSLGWIHPHIFLDLLLWANPKFKVQVYDWLNDYLIQNRIDGADSYIIMNGALHARFPNKSQYPKFISRVNAEIKQIIGVTDWNKASQNQLKERDYLQKLIVDMTAAFRDSSKAYDFAKSVYLSSKNAQNNQLIKGS